jgi:iron(III) transport system substrate-binding protein
MVFYGCDADNVNERVVVIYTSVDQVYAEPILQAFQKRSGIRVLPVFDVEATKTTGLVNRLIAEKDHPLADVFWNGEFAQTILLKEKDLLSPYHSPNRSDIPTQFRDAEGYWTGFSGRARVLIINTDLVPVSEYPESVFDLLDEKFPAGRIGIAYPLFGTTATHAAAIYAALGDTQGRSYFEKIHKRGVRVVDGNSVVRDLVASGRLVFGLTDTDDACGAIKRGAQVTALFPDQKEDALGTLIIPNTVALIANAPHQTEGKALIDFLLTAEVEGQLVASGWSHIPLRPSGVKSACLETSEIRGMNVNLVEIYGQLDTVKRDLAKIFIQ